ncbi:MAG: restriction endonuclease subunit S [Saprospiraceae bacterium]|nr:restriction endonuclease subunit S [Saprospiraceae bacterium]
MGNWIENSLGNLIVEEKKSTIQVQGATNFGDYPFFTSGDNVLIHDKYLVDGEKLFLATGGKANIKFYNGKAAYSTDTYVISSEKASTQYLYYFLLNQIDFINSNLFTGSGLKHLQKNDFKKFKFKLPEEKPEQTRIAQILSKADAAIAQTEALIAKYQRIKTGLMQDLLTCGIDEHGNIRSKATHRFVVKNGIEVPEEWEVDCLATLIKAVDAHPSHRTPPSVENGIPYLGISDIDEYGNIDLKKCRKVSLSVLQEHNNRYQLRDGDIIFGKIGTIGEPKRLKAWREVTISANVILIQPHNTPGFIFWVLNSDFIKTQVKNTIHSTTQPAFGMEKIRTLIIPFPPKPEREQIEKILNKSEDNLISTRIRLYKLQSLKIGLMQDLLAGKVRVKIKEELA